jgi:hypothetical protein
MHGYHSLDRRSTEPNITSLRDLLELHVVVVAGHTNPHVNLAGLSYNKLISQKKVTVKLYSLKLTHTYYIFFWSF